ncbi:hypothetical protein NDU88_001777 [Pleurodeles waltl]|uniref:Uncharacterized protein n=1 Tax=Pleurodeles waltl TaxID=8319 RepID=A0AAV7Q723_PLEWA|nr:hypothetical protein NDU88_001777 [Pleurodeles waltl]
MTADIAPGVILRLKEGRLETDGGRDQGLELKATTGKSAEPPGENQVNGGERSEEANILLSGWADLIYRIGGTGLR